MKAVKLNRLKELNEAYQAEVKATAMDAVKEAVHEFLSEHKNVKAVKWSQYTPYFNDGEACVFQVYEPEFLWEGEEEYIDLYSYNDKSYAREVKLVRVPYNSKLSEDASLLVSLLQNNVNVLEVALGEGEIVATAKGIDITDVSHD